MALGFKLRVDPISKRESELGGIQLAKSEFAARIRNLIYRREM